MGNFPDVPQWRSEDNMRCYVGSWCVGRGIRHLEGHRLLESKEFLGLQLGHGWLHSAEAWKARCRRMRHLKAGKLSCGDFCRNCLNSKQRQILRDRFCGSIVNVWPRECCTVQLVHTFFLYIFFCWCWV